MRHSYAQQGLLLLLIFFFSFKLALEVDIGI
jgi:hypothetical protein